MTGFEPEPTPDLTGQIVGSTLGFGIAFALTRQSAGGSIRWIQDVDCGNEHRKQTLPVLADFLEQSGETSFRLAIPGAGYIEIAPGERSAPPVLRRAG
jgi:hypothetical protein